MKRLAMALVAAGLAAGTFAGVAYAAKKVEEAYSADQKKKGAADTPALVASAGLKCTVKNAAYIGEGTTKVDGKSMKQFGYEVACGEGPGYVLIKLENGTINPITCIQAKAGYDANGGKGILCKLPENADLNAQVQPFMTAAGTKCTVSNVLYVGSSASAKVDRYEVACSEGGGYMLDAPGAGSTATAQASSCLAAASTGYQCKLTPKAAQIAPISALAASADKSCQVSDVRWVGIEPTSKNVFYEVACTGRAGFIMETSPAGALVKSTDCVRASGIGGGCKLTDMTQARAGAAQTYAAALKSNNVACTPQDYREIGEETGFKRSVIEFKCPERPAGLVAFIPQAGSTKKFESMDCLTAEGRNLKCSFASREAILAMLEQSVKAGGKTCGVTGYNIHGPSMNGDIVEVACTGMRGWVMDLPTARGKPALIEDCKRAALSGDRCVMAENKLAP
jgi:hypothetical protein